MDAIQALQTAQRGIKGLYSKEEFDKDSTSKAGLLVAITYLQGQIDLYEAQKGNDALNEELQKALEAPELPEAEDGVIETQETKTGTFEAVQQSPQTNKRSRRD